MKELNQPFDEDKVDLRIMIQVLLRRWVILVIFTFVSGLIAGAASLLLNQSPAYEASAVIYSVNPEFTHLLTSNSMMKVATGKLGFSNGPSLNVTIVANEADNSLITVTAQSQDPQQAIKIVNEYADAIVNETKTNLTSDANNSISEAKSIAENADLALVTYLQQQNLNNMSWSQLIDLTGVANSNSFIIQNSQNLSGPLLVSTEQRLEIAELMREKVSAEQTYQNISNTEQVFINELENSADLYVANYAVSAGTQGPKLARNIALGAVAGLLFAVFGIFIVDWWQNQKIDTK